MDDFFFHVNPKVSINLVHLDRNPMGFSNWFMDYCRNKANTRLDYIMIILYEHFYKGTSLLCNLTVMLARKWLNANIS